MLQCLIRIAWLDRHPISHILSVYRLPFDTALTRLLCIVVLATRSGAPWSTHMIDSALPEYPKAVMAWSGQRTSLFWLGHFHPCCLPDGLKQVWTSL